LPAQLSRAWFDTRTLPRWRGGRFRRWLRGAGEKNHD
jgi:hypothetical protein